MRDMREATDMSMNSLSVYIWRPPRMYLSIWYSIVKALPEFYGFCCKACNTCAFWVEVSSSAEIIVIFSSLLNCW